MLAGKWLKVNARVSVEGKCVGKMDTNLKLPPGCPQITLEVLRLHHRNEGDILPILASSIVTKTEKQPSQNQELKIWLIEFARG